MRCGFGVKGRVTLYWLGFSHALLVGPCVDKTFNAINRMNYPPCREYDIEDNNGAGGRTRTDTTSPSRDFESLVYTNFTTPACIDRQVARTKRPNQPLVELKLSAGSIRNFIV